MRLNDFYFPSESVFVTVPRQGYVRRNRKHVQEPILMIHGCAGLGKTVYLAQLADDWKDCAVYVSLSDRDGDEEALAAHLYQALVSVIGEDPFSDGEVSVGQIVSYFVKTMSEKDGILLLDHLDMLSTAPSCRIIGNILESAANGCFHAAAVGRSVPNCMLRYILGGVCAELTASDLLFTVSETAENISLQLPSESVVLSADSGLPSPVIAESLHIFADGWPAAEVMLLKEIASGKDKELNLVSAAERSHLSKFISYNILDSMSEELRAYVKHTAFLNHCDTDMCRTVLHENNSGEKLSYLISNGILVSAGCGSDYPEYPPAVRYAVRGMIAPDERKRLADKAVCYFVSKERIAEAAALLEECGDADTVEDILSRFGNKLIENREFELIGYCSDIIDRYSMPSNAAVLGVLAQYYYYEGLYGDMERTLNMADSMFGKENVYSAYRGLYNGLLKFGKNPELYTDNVCRFLEYLNENGYQLPFLHPKEQELLDQIIHTNKPVAEKPLKLNRFGRFTLALADRNSDITWRTKKACEFMAFMIERGGKPVERDHLIDALWRDHMPNNVVAMLHNIIYSLRKELSEPQFKNFISYKDKCYALNMSLIGDEDEKIFSACKAVSEKNTAELLRHEECFASYWGKYLGTLDCEWANELREYYDKCYVDGCLMLASHFHAESAFSKELVFLKNASSIDPYSEQIIREIIYCHIAMGYPNKAMARYDEYCVLIDEELGIEPSKWLKKEYLACFSENRS